MLMKKTNILQKQKILVIQQNGRGETKIQGIQDFGGELFELEIISIEIALPPVIDDARPFLPSEIAADLVLDYLNHPDLSHDLGRICREKDIPVVASGKKSRQPLVFTPPTCCGLSRQKVLGAYGQYFGAPEFEVQIDQNGDISRIDVIRGAPCGATWKAADRIKGMNIDKASVRIGLETQFFCTADPSGWDPIYGKSPVHFAGHVHTAAFKKACKR